MPQNSLEQEAMDRVRRMYSSFDSRRTGNAPVRQPDTVTGSGDRAEPKPNAGEKKEPVFEPAADHESVEKPPDSILDVFMKDRDRSLILLLLVLLMKDGADMNLLLALVYLLI